MLSQIDTNLDRQFLLYVQLRGKAPEYIGMALDVAAAKAALAMMAARWRLTKPGRLPHFDGLSLTLRHSDKKLASIAWAEGVPVPAKEPDAQPRRVKGGAK